MRRSSTGPVQEIIVEHTDSPPALTSLAEDEILLRDSVAEFAEAQIRPRVREMDEHAKFPQELLAQLFGLGVMGIESPDAEPKWT